ncbi:MAG TPA: NADP-dependent oxidoreductase [Opitutaceae bacterium]|jgi:NADPH:quinone reductase-like Zn-dependent oxidoreductase
MKAVRIHSFGSSEVMQIEEVATPKPMPGEILIRVCAASVNPVDYKVRSGQFRPPGLHMPLTLGRDVSGVVEAVGRGVSEIDVGDEVFALLDRDHGGYAEFVIVRSDSVAAKPASLDHVHAAAVPLAAITAWQGLFDHGNLKRGERVLIHGAAGGVGHFAVQFARNKGAYVIVTARQEDIGLMKTLGADEVIDYQKDRFEDRATDVDLVFDLVAGETQNRSWHTLKKGGHLVSTLPVQDKGQGAPSGVTGESYMAEPNRWELEEIARLIDNRKVQVVVQETLPLAEARRAHEFLEHEHVRGKVVLEVAEV